MPIWKDEKERQEYLAISVRLMKEGLSLKEASMKAVKEFRKLKGRKGPFDLETPKSDPA